MLNSKNRTIVKRIGDKIEFTIARFHCTSWVLFRKDYVLVDDSKKEQI